MDSKPLKILYTNFKGKTSVRNIIPQEIYFGTTEWYKDEQWLLDAIDVDKGAIRTFAVNNIDFIYSDNDERKIDRIKKEFKL